MTAPNPRYCHWCHETRAEYYTFVGHALVCSDRCPKRPRLWNHTFLRLVDPYRGAGVIYLTPEEYDEQLDDAADAILQAHHPRLLRAPAEQPEPPTGYVEGGLCGQTSGHYRKGDAYDGARGSRPCTQTHHQPNRPPPLEGLAGSLSSFPAPGHRAPWQEFKGIEKTAEMCHGCARLEGTNVPVWMIVDAQIRGASVEEMEAHWAITPEQIEGALMYWDAYPTEIADDLERGGEPVPLPPAPPPKIKPTSPSSVQDWIDRERGGIPVHGSRFIDGKRQPRGGPPED
jgi:uncharacterized protein (DUF433 family)